MNVILGMLGDVISGSAKQRVSAVEAFDTPPLNITARRWAAFTLVMFLAASILLLSAALVDVLLGNRRLSEICGWTGIVGLQLCVVGGLRYKSVNTPEQRGLRD